MISKQDIENFQNSPIYEFFVQYLSEYIVSAQNTLEVSDKEQDIFRSQGEISSLRQVKDFLIQMNEHNQIGQDDER